MGQCVLREWVVGGGGLYGYFRKQGLTVGVQECSTYVTPTTRAFTDEILQIAEAQIIVMTTEHYIVFKGKNWLGFFKNFMAA